MFMRTKDFIINDDNIECHDGKMILNVSHADIDVLLLDIWEKGDENAKGLILNKEQCIHLMGFIQRKFKIKSMNDYYTELEKNGNLVLHKFGEQ